MVSCVQFYVEIPVGGSLGETQQTEAQRGITISTGSTLLFLGTLQSLLSSKAAWGCVKNQAVLRSQNTTLLMPGHRPLVS